jgi:hypothetical protein
MCRARVAVFQQLQHLEISRAPVGDWLVFLSQGQVELDDNVELDDGQVHIVRLHVTANPFNALAEQGTRAGRKYNLVGDGSERGSEDGEVQEETRPPRFGLRIFMRSSFTIWMRHTCSSNWSNRLWIWV